MSSLGNVPVSESDKEVKGRLDEGKKSGPDLKNFPCRRPAHANPRLFEFHRYLELTGVTKALSGALGSLCAQKPKPEKPMDFIVDKMREAGDVTKWSEGVISLRNELSQLRTLVMYAERENERVRGFLIRSGQLSQENEEFGEDDEEEEEEEEFEDEAEEQLEIVPIIPIEEPIVKVKEKPARKVKSKKRNN